MMTSEDGRYIVVDGRRWRATDPTIPPALRGELVNALMAARRAVGAARRSGDPEAERVARSGVGDAKVALGERGDPWWDPPTDEGLRKRGHQRSRPRWSRGGQPGGAIVDLEVPWRGPVRIRSVEGN